MRAAYVLDTGVIVTALRSRNGASRLLLNAAAIGRFDLLLSVPLLVEYEAVLSRPEQLAACGLNPVELGQVLDNLAAVARPVHVSYRWRPMLTDPDDEMVMETALNGGATALVTFNQRHFARMAGHSHCEVLVPSAALQRIGGRTT